VVKKIKVFTSESTAKNTHTPAFDLTMLKDITGWPGDATAYQMQPAPSRIIYYGGLVHHYSYKNPHTLIKPPIA
jgi:hypothetical protein